MTDGSTRKGAQNIFISKIFPPNAGTGTSQLVYSIYLGGSQVDSLAGISVDSNSNIYVAGSTTSSDFPTQNGLPFTVTGGTQHGFVSAITFNAQTVVYSLTYSTYLAGNGIDTVTGLAIDGTGNAFVTGITTSTNDQSNGFPANPNGFQLVSHAPSQFFASKIFTKSSGSQSMIYSTYLGGGNPQSGQTQGGGIAVDTAGNMYITGATNFLPVDGPNQGEVRFPLNLAYQSCLDEASKTACAPKVTQPRWTPSSRRSPLRLDSPSPSIARIWADRATTLASASRSIPPTTPMSPARPPLPIGLALALAFRRLTAPAATPSSPRSAALPGRRIR